MKTLLVDPQWLKARVDAPVVGHELRYKRCSICKERKEISEFYLRSDRASKARPACKTCQKSRQKALYGTIDGRARMVASRLRWESKPSSKLVMKNSDLKRKYGMTIDELNDLFASQDGLCGICRVRMRRTNHASDALHVDHCHKTKIVRGLLCSRCNTGLGLFKDAPDILKNAIAYLTKQVTHETVASTKSVA